MPGRKTVSKLVRKEHLDDLIPRLLVASLAAEDGNVAPSTESEVAILPPAEASNEESAATTSSSSANTSYNMPGRKTVSKLFRKKHLADLIPRLLVASPAADDGNVAPSTESEVAILPLAAEDGNVAPSTESEVAILPLAADDGNVAPSTESEVAILPPAEASNEDAAATTSSSSEPPFKRALETSVVAIKSKKARKSEVDRLTESANMLELLERAHGNELKYQLRSRPIFSLATKNSVPPARPRRFTITSYSRSASKGASLDGRSTVNFFEFATLAPKSSPKPNTNSKIPAAKFNPLKTTAKTNEDSVSPSMSEVGVFKDGGVAQIVLSTNRAPIRHTFTVQMLNKLSEVLTGLRDDGNCKVVVMTTNGAHFCQGVDVNSLLVGSAHVRRDAAVVLADAIKLYLRTLGTFPKPLIAGVVGQNSGLGVMQLPLFDVVVGSDDGSYKTAYTEVGQLPEGYVIWNTLQKVQESFKTKLLLLNAKLDAAESKSAGLVNELMPACKVNERAVSTARKIAAQPQQPHLLMKKAAIAAVQDSLGNQLDNEFEQIVEQWLSSHA